MPEDKESSTPEKVLMRPDMMPKDMLTSTIPKEISGTRLRLKADGKSAPVADSRMA